MYDEATVAVARACEPHGWEPGEPGSPGHDIWLHSSFYWRQAALRRAAVAVAAYRRAERAVTGIRDRYP